MMTSLFKQWKFVAEIEKLKQVTRANLTMDDRFENSAEHSWQTALTALTLKEHYPYPINIESVIQMILLHDVGEIYAGDTYIFDDSGKAISYDNELVSMKKTLAMLPEQQAEEYLALWNEFELGNTHETKYARIIDALVPMISHLEVAPVGYNPGQLTKGRVIAKKQFINDDAPELWKLAQDIINKSVEKGLYI